VPSVILLLALGTGGGHALIAQSGAPYDVVEKSITELQEAMAAGRVSAAQLVEIYLRRIAAYDQAGPRLKAVLHLNANAGREARALDAERTRQGPRGPLHGIPVLLKDNFETRDMPTTGGALALAGVVPVDDAFQVRKLRQAGAVILGKVNLHELALGLTTVSSLGGQTLNPYDIRRAPGGSSGGSGVAAAASFAAFTMGTDTAGSIRIPSSHNSLVGLRPTLGLSSRAGIIPFGHTQDSAGPMARNVTDVALVLDATVGYDPGDPITGTSSGRIPRTYTSTLKPEALQGARVGVIGEFFGTAPEDDEVAVLVRRAIDDMKARGATAVEVVIPNLAQQLTASSLLTQELKLYLGGYLRTSPRSPVGSIEELLASGLHAAQLQGFLDAANAVADDYLAGDDYRSRFTAREALGRAVLAAMDANKLDALVYPTVRRVAPLAGTGQLGSNAALSAQTGFPSITVPAGFTPGGLPVGVEMLGRPFGEPTLLGLAYAYERATNHRRPPGTTPPLKGTSAGPLPVVASSDTGPGSVTFRVTATGAQSVPRTDVPFALTASFNFNGNSRQLGYELRLSGAAQQVGGIYLHRRANRPNGGVAHILARPPGVRSAGTVTLNEAEAADLRAGKLYVAAVSARDPRLGARGNLVLP
jgi:Asp-tRNA(Asn)/Glu-tRNA(Gln) amidotransferase A subunit family amidase